MSTGLLEFFSAPLFVSAVVRTPFSPRLVTSIEFKLHMLTGTLIFLLSCFIFSKELTGNHIHCIAEGVDVSGGRVSQKAFDSYCYISNTFTLPAQKKLSYRGVGPYSIDSKESVQYHNYYVWIPYLLFFQSISFFIPSSLYRFFEEGRTEILLAGLQNLMPSPDMREDIYGDLGFYFKDWYNHLTWWAIKLTFAEILSPLMILLNIFLIDWYLNDQFLDYGMAYINYISSESKLKEIDPFNLIFPKMTKCFMKTYGPSGTIQAMDGLCILPINVLNEKIFMFLWFTLWILTVISILHFLFSALLCCAKSLRESFLVSFISPQRSDVKEKLREILSATGFGDWKLLYVLARNTDKVVFSEIIQNLRHPDFNHGCEPTDQENNPSYLGKKYTYQ